jgi:molecular chaperone HtpG
MLLIDELRKAIKKYADFIPYQIFLNDEGVPANAVNAPWHLNFTSENERLSEYTAFVGKRFPEDAILETIPVALRTTYRVDGVLYISDRLQDITPTIEGQLEIYQNRMFVTSKSSHVLPLWAQFINGVLDSPDLTLTASRDAIQHDHVAQQIRDALAEIIVQHLQNMSKKAPEQFELIMRWHTSHIKNMALKYDDFFEAIADLVPFETNRGVMNLRRYCEQSLKLEQNHGYDIFYFGERESASRYYMLCDAKAMLVINAGRNFEEEFLEKYAKKRSDIRLHSLSREGADFLFEQTSIDEESVFHQLVMDFYAILVGQPIQIRMVHFKPKTIPAITSLESSARLRQELQAKQQSVYISKAMKDLLGRVLKEQKMSQVLLFLNADNPIIQKMAQMAEAHNNDTIAYQAAIYAIYNNASLLSSHLMTPEATQSIFTSSTETINLMIEQAEQLTQMQSKLSATQLSLRSRARQEYSDHSPSSVRSKQIICVVALPPHDTATMAYESLLFPALRKVLEFGPYYWHVVRADERYFDRTRQGERSNGMTLPHIYMAEMTELDPQVVMELGYMCGKKQDWQAVTILQAEHTQLQLPQLEGMTTLTYPAQSSQYTLSEMVEQWRDLFTGNERIQRINRLREEHYLSPLFLQEELWMPQDVASALSQAYGTFEALASARIEEITSRISNFTAMKARRLQQSILEILEETSPDE